MARQTHVIWVTGNHDAALPDSLPGEICTEWRDGPFRFRHEAIADSEAGAFELSGHYHPKATVPVRGTAVTRPCFVTDGHRRLILPAFGAYTGGLDVADPAIAGLFPRGGRVFLLGQGRLFHFQLGRARARVAAA